MSIPDDVSDDQIMTMEEKRFLDEETHNERKKTISKRFQSSVKTLASATLGDVNGLYNMTLSTLLIYFGFAIALFAVWGAVDTNASNTGIKYFIFTHYTYQLNDAFTVNFTVLAAISCLLAGLGAAFDVISWPSIKLVSLRCRTNWVRWVVDSLQTPLLTVSVLALFGINDLTTLLFQFLVVHAAIVCGGITELVNSPWNMSNRTYNVSWWPFLGAVWIGVAGVLPTIVVLARSRDLNNLPALGISAFTLLLAAWATQSLLQYWYYSWLSNPQTMSRLFSEKSSALKNYIRYESWLSITNVLFRLAIAALLAFSYSGSLDWITQHRCSINYIDNLLDKFEPLVDDACLSTFYRNATNTTFTPGILLVAP